MYKWQGWMQHGAKVKYTKVTCVSVMHMAQAEFQQDTETHNSKISETEI